MNFLLLNLQKVVTQANAWFPTFCAEIVCKKRFARRYREEQIFFKRTDNLKLTGQIT